MGCPTKGTLYLAKCALHLRTTVFASFTYVCGTWTFLGTKWHFVAEMPLRVAFRVAFLEEIVLEFGLCRSSLAHSLLDSLVGHFLWIYVPVSPVRGLP